MPRVLEFRPPVIAHRGASGYAPENTLSAFAKAAQMNIKWIEFDVMLSACDTPVIFHDDELTRTTNGHGSIGDYPFNYLRTLDAGAWFKPCFSGERIPSLAEILMFLQGVNLSANIEIKPLPGQDKKTALKTFAEFSHAYSTTTNHILFSSFSIDALRALRALSTDCLIGLLMDEWLPDWQHICDELKCVSVHVSNKILTEEMATKIKHSGRQVLCYTVNDPARAKELFSWGVSAVFSDYPDRILAVSPSNSPFASSTS